MYAFAANLQIGSGSEIQSRIVQEDIVQVILSSILVFVGLISFCALFMRIQPKTFISFGCFAILLGLNTLTANSKIIYSMYGNPTFWGIMSMMSFYLLPAAFNAFMIVTMKASRKNPFYWLGAASGLFAVIITVLACINLNYLIPPMEPFFAFILINAVGAIVFASFKAIRGKLRRTALYYAQP